MAVDFFSIFLYPTNAEISIISVDSGWWKLVISPLTPQGLNLNASFSG